MGALLDLTGQRFGRLLVVERGENRGRHVMWRCQCACATERIVRAGHLRSGATQGCGCLSRSAEHRAQAAALATKHGHAVGKRSPEYWSWTCMIRRCTNPNTDSFKYYGMRGIRVCERWRYGEDGKSGFECFLEDMGLRPRGHTLDRIEVNANYDPGNCRWATAKTQARNRRYGSTRKLTALHVQRIRVLGGSMSPRQIGARFGVSTGAVRNILAGRRWREETP
jgi:hypothetical protein